MKTTQQRNPRSGFTLIEMVGVLAVIAILAALLVPKIFAAIEESHINSAVTACNTIKSATMSKFGRDGVFATDTATSNWGDKLLADGLLEAAPKIRIATTSTEVNCTAYDDTTDPGQLFTNLDGKGTKPSGNMVYVTLSNVSAERAYELSRRIDGDALSNSDLAEADDKGRVVYDTPTAGMAKVYVYLAHR